MLSESKGMDFCMWLCILNYFCSIPLAHLRSKAHQHHVRKKRRSEATSEHQFPQHTDSRPIPSTEASTRDRSGTQIPGPERTKSQEDMP